MDKQSITKEEINRFLESKDEVRGSFFTGFKKHIINRKGEEGIKQIEQYLKDLGIDFEFSEIGNFKYYPYGIYLLFLEAVASLCEFSDNDFYEKGAEDAKLGAAARGAFINYLLSLEKAAQSLPYFYSKLHTKGKMSVLKIDKENKIGILRHEGLITTNKVRQINAGYLAGNVHIIIGKKPSCEIKKCEEEDNCWDYIFRW